MRNWMYNKLCNTLKSMKVGETFVLAGISNNYIFELKVIETQSYNGVSPNYIVIDECTPLDDKK